MKVLILILSILNLSWAQVDPILPPLPDSYSSNIQVNYQDTLRGDKAGVPIASEGQSFSLYEAVDDGLEPNFTRALLYYRLELNRGEDNAFNIEERIIWNPFLDGVKQFLNIISFGPTTQATECMADSVHDQSMWNVIFGATGGQVPSVAHMLHWGSKEGYQRMKGENIQGIPCDKYNGTLRLDETDLKGEVTIFYWWNSATEWISTGGSNISLPVQAALEGFVEYQGKTRDVKVTFVFEEFMLTTPPNEVFEPPPDIFCQGRAMKQHVPGIPEFFSYTSEGIFYYEPPEILNKPPVYVVSTRTESYDYLQKVSRVVYKPIDFSNLDDPYAGNNQGFVSEVKDFSSGIMYLTWQNYGNCSARFIGMDIHGDVHVNDDGTIDMNTPFEMFGGDRLYAKNGEYETRGIYVTSYVSTLEEELHPVGPYGQKTKSGHTNITTVIEYSAGVLTTGEDEPQYKVPVAMEKFPTNDYSDKSKRHRYNIIGFVAGEPDFNTFDITPCFGQKQLQHRMIRTGWSDQFIIGGGLKTARDQARLSLAAAAKVTPIRIQNIELFEEPEEPALYVLFTIVDFLTGIDGVDEGSLADEVTRPLSEAVSNMKSVIKSGQLKIELPLIGGGYGASSASPDYFIKVDRSVPYDSHGNTSPDKKYTPGAMAGLAFGMILMGLVLSGCLYFFILRPKIRSQIPTIRGFDNPLHGSANLAS